MNRETWSAIIDESHKKGLKAARPRLLPQGCEGCRLTTAWTSSRHSIRDQDVTPELVAEMKQKNVSYIPTLTRDLSVFVYESTPDFIKDPFFLRGMSLYKDQVAIADRARVAGRRCARIRRPQMIKRRARARRTQNLKILSDAGITIAHGHRQRRVGAGNAGRWQGYFEQLEMEMMNKAGMSPMKVIVASTGDAAKIMGLKQVGTLQPGNWADLVVLRANPLDNIRNTRTIDSVWIAGGKLADVHAGHEH